MTYPRLPASEHILGRCPAETDGQVSAEEMVKIRLFTLDLADMAVTQDIQGIERAMSGCAMESDLVTECLF